MSGALMFLTNLAYSDGLGRRAKNTAGLVVTLTGLVVSLTRAAWVGFGIGVLIIVSWMLAKRKYRSASSILGSLVAVGVVVALAISIVLNGTSVGELVVARLDTFSRIPEDGAIRSRVSDYEMALRLWASRPVLGWGTGGFERVFQIGYAHGIPWVENWVIQALFDTGALGLCVLVALVAKLGLDAVHSLRDCLDPAMESTILSLLVSSSALMVSYLSTSAMWLSFTWVHLGFLGSATRVAILGRDKELPADVD